MAKFQKPRLLSVKEINIIRGKAIVGHATPAELMQVFSHWDLMEAKMDEVEGGGISSAYRMRISTI